MTIQKKNNRRAVKASRVATRAARRRAIRAAEEMDEEVEEVEEVGGVDVAPEASDLLFEAEDVAELVAEVTGQEVSVTVEDDVVTFEVGEDAYAVEAEGDEEILETTRKPLRGKSSVRASRRVARGNRRPVRARR